VSGRLSVCIIACNEERDLPRCLRSVAFADERIVVVDARSADGTESLARESGAQVHVRRYDGNVEQKNFALDQATGDWVLAVDADEAVSADLREAIRDALGGTSGDGLPADAFEVDRLTWHLGRWIRHGDFHPDWQLRLFRRGAGRWDGTNPHGRVSVEGPVKRLSGSLEHYSYRDLADQVGRIQEFSRIQARELYAAGRRARVSDWLLRPPGRFLPAARRIES
jgi:glycosyltransferase involved in cell wall biosynthesis